MSGPEVAQQVDPTIDISNLDQLTGIYNRHFFANYFSQEAREAQRARKPLSLAVMDLDHFKVHNQNFGYEGGNELLSQLGPVIYGYCVDQGIIPVRYSGDEFVLLMAEMPHEEAAVVADELRAVIEAETFRVLGVDTRLTVSIGVATYPTHASETYDLYDAAFSALSIAKKKGRNQVCTPASEARVLFTHDNFHRLFPCPRVVGRSEIIAKVKPFLTLKKNMGRPCILLTGAEGSGKSRMIDLFEGMVDLNETVSLTVKAQPYLVNQPYGIILELLRYVIRIHPAWIDTLLEHIELDEQRAIAPLIPELVEPEMTEYGTLLDPFEEMGDDARAIITTAFVKLVLALGSGKPINLFVDDFQWAEGGTADVLENIKNMRDGDAALILLAARRTGDQLCDGPKSVVEYVNNGLKNKSLLHFDLEPLSYHNVPEIIDTIIPGLQRNKRLAQIVTNRSKAVPLVVEEILKYLLQKELIVSNDGILMVNEFAEEDVPSSLDEIVAARTRELESEVQDLVKMTSVVGATFDVKTLTELEFGAEGPLRDAIDKGVRICLIKDNGDEFSFVADAVQEAVYKQVDKATKVKIHTRVAELEEHRRGDVIDCCVGKLAYHHERAGNVERARGVLTRLEKYELQSVGNVQAAPGLNPVFISQMSETVPVLIKDLESGDSHKISKAATTLIRKGGFAIKPLLGLISSSDDLRARRIALQCLNRIGTKVLSTMLESLHKTQDYTEKCRIIATLEYYEDDSIFQVLEPFIHYPEDTVRREAMRVLETLNGEQLPASIMSATHDSTLAVRLDAIATAGRMKLKDAIPHLLRIIRKRTIFFPDYKVEEQRHACMALAEIGDSVAIEPLEAVLRHAPWWTLMRNKKPEVRAAAASALASFPVAEPTLKRALRDREALVRSAAHTAINQLHGVFIDKKKKKPTSDPVDGLEDELPSTAEARADDDGEGPRPKSPWDPVDVTERAPAEDREEVDVGGSQVQCQ